MLITGYGDDVFVRTVLFKWFKQLKDCRMTATDSVRASHPLTHQKLAILTND